jgi:methionyl-tRNA formyltransferase
MDIIFMGSPDFAVPSLEILQKSEDINILKVVSQPDSKKGRGQKLRPTPVKKEAIKFDLDVMTSDNVNDRSFINSLKKLSPDAIVVVAFGHFHNIYKVSCYFLPRS